MTNPEFLMEVNSWDFLEHRINDLPSWPAFVPTPRNLRPRDGVPVILRPRDRED